MATGSINTHTHAHAALGPLTGRLEHSYNGEVVHFRSIPYALVPARFKPSEPLSHIPADYDGRPHRDFTVYGAACPQLPGEVLVSPQGEVLSSGMGPKYGAAYGGPLGEGDSVKFDDLRCTHLSVAVPRGVLEEEAKVPVLVYVHGGGLAEGIGHVDELHCGVRLSGFGAREDRPCIVVNVGYRLGWFGFLTCQDVLEEARAEGRRGADGEEVFNWGLHDQRKAFRWIKQFIGGFGGDADNVTAFGESAGSVSLAYHLCGSEPLFRKAVLMSSVVWGQSTFEEKEQYYQTVLLAQARITAKTGAERLKALRDMDGFALGKMGPAVRHLLPYYGEDSTMFDRGVPLYMKQFDLISSCPWVEAIIVGSDQFEGSILMQYVQGANSAMAAASIRAAMKDSPLIDQVLAEYENLSPDTPWALGWPEFARFLGDIYITEGTHTLAEALSKAGRKVYHYTFALSNPWPGSDLWNVAGHHFVEILYLFLTLNERYPKRRDRFLERQAEETARRWISFAHGNEPWAPYESPEGVSAVCDDVSGWHERTRDEDLRMSQQELWGVRRYKATDLIRRVWREMEEKEGTEVVETAREYWLANTMQAPGQNGQK